MNTYNIVIKGADGNQSQLGVRASSWQNAIDAAKQEAGIAFGSAPDDALLIAQWTGTIQVEGN